MRRMGLRLAVVLGVLIATPAPAALAAPNDSSATSTFPMECDGTTVTLTIGGGPWSAARVLETGEVFVPVATHVYLRDPDTGDVVYEEHDFKGAERTGDSRCVEDFTTRSGLLGSFVVEGELHS